ncbi:MAG: hypothetical protein WCG23_06990 [bacterium]
MNNESIKEEIKFLTETVKMFWAVSIGLSGGVATLFTNLNNINKYILLIFGLIFLINAIMIINDLNKQIYRLIKKTGD